MLSQKSFLPWDYFIPYNLNNVSLSLSDPPPGAPVRLVDGSNTMEGRVEIFHDDEWGTVCDDYWDSIDARVVCNQLGFVGEAYAVSAFQFGAGDLSMSIWLDNVHCTGTETYLSECRHYGWGVHNCGHFEDAGVVCQGQCLTVTHSCLHLSM